MSDWRPGSENPPSPGAYLEWSFDAPDIAYFTGEVWLDDEQVVRDRPEFWMEIPPPERKHG